MSVGAARRAILTCSPCTITPPATAHRIYHAVSGLWIYPFLDYDKPIHAAYYVGVFLLFMAAFAVANAIHLWRAQLWPVKTRARADSCVSLKPEGLV